MVKRVGRRRSGLSVRERLEQGGLRSGQSGDKLMRQMAQEYGDVLQNIEFTLVQAHRQQPQIDDRAAELVLKEALTGRRESFEPQVADLREELSAMRDLRQDIDEEIWRKCLRVVLDSVHTHSDCRSGQTDYLDFAGDFLP